MLLIIWHVLESASLQPHLMLILTVGTTSLVPESVMDLYKFSVQAHHIVESSRIIVEIYMKPAVGHCKTFVTNTWSTTHIYCQ